MQRKTKQGRSKATVQGERHEVLVGALTFRPFFPCGAPAQTGKSRGCKSRLTKE